MKVKQIISSNVSRNQMEVIADNGKTLKTLHIHKNGDTWKYFVGYDKKDTKIYASIDVWSKHKLRDYTPNPLYYVYLQIQ